MLSFTRPTFSYVELPHAPFRNASVYIRNVVREEGIKGREKLLCTEYVGCNYLSLPLILLNGITLFICTNSSQHIIHILFRDFSHRRHICDTGGYCYVGHPKFLLSNTSLRAKFF